MTGNTAGSSPRISLIVAMAKNRVIGRENKLPWHLPADLKRFKSLTMGHHIVMGRKTFESIGKPLPGRTSVVITRNKSYRAAGATVRSSIGAALDAIAGDDEIFVIGGGELYREALGQADRIYLTEILVAMEGDTFFPPLEPGAWDEIARERHATTEGAGHAFDFVILDRRR